MRLAASPYSALRGGMCDVPSELTSELLAYASSTQSEG